jgi:hypothetical protein
MKSIFEFDHMQKKIKNKKINQSTCKIHIHEPIISIQTQTRLKT